MGQRASVVIFGFLFLVLAGRAWAQSEPHGTTVCEDSRYSSLPEYRALCNRGGRTGPVAPIGPSPEELRQRAEANDLDEAAQDADDKGIKAYNRGEYATAINWFRKALDYTPDNDAIARNLSLARLRLAQLQPPPPRPTPPPPAPTLTDARRQLKAMSEDKPNGDRREDVSDHARKGFDTPVRDHGAPAPIVRSVTHRADPVVPPDRMTPRIEAMESARTRDREKLKTLNAALKTLDPKTEPVKVAKLKQEISKTTSEVQYQNFSITEELAKPPPAKTPTKDVAAR